MAIRLKNDWKAHGNNPTARRMADWMNTVADLFNFAHVPSGGTAQPTERGFQIEVDGGDGDGRPQLDHAFLPTQTGVTEATLTPGYVTDRNGTRRSITTATTVGATWAGGVIDFTTDKCWWVQIKYVATEGSTQGDFEELRWEKGASFPAHRAGIGAALGYTVNIPVIEFPNNEWPSMIRRQTNDIIDSPHALFDFVERLRWEQIRMAQGSTNMVPLTDDVHDLITQHTPIGGRITAWKNIEMECRRQFDLRSSPGQDADTGDPLLGGVWVKLDHRQTDKLLIGIDSAIGIAIVDAGESPQSHSVAIRGTLRIERNVSVLVSGTRHAGASGTFVDNDGKTVRVRHGIITNLNET